MDEWAMKTDRLVNHYSCQNRIETGKRADLLRSYYKHLFPFEDICNWLSYGNLDSLHCREFSYLVLSKYFMRYKTFDHFREMKYEIYNASPVKIDIGGLFSRRPGKRRSRVKKARLVERELTFDIDLSDYNDVRTCCKGTSICLKCWKLAAIACKILNSSLREDFGFRHILWVFSGRRGIHCWVCDPSVRRLTSKQRRQIIEYYNLKKSVLTKRPIDLGQKELLHAQIVRSYNIAVQAFVPICINEQNILGTPEGVNKFISLLPIDSCRQKVTQLFTQCSTSQKKWTNFCKYWKSEEQSRTTLWKLRPHLMKEIILWYLYPRLDASVTETMNHLLKAPFSFHPDTLLLCAPFDPEKVDEFIFSEMPTLEKLVEAAVDRATNRDGLSVEHIQVQIYKKVLCIFKNFVKSLKEPLASAHD